MPKAVQGSANNPTADGSARTTQSRHHDRSSNSGTGDGAKAAGRESAESTPEKSPSGTSGSEAVKPDAADAEPGTKTDPKPDARPDTTPGTKPDSKPGTTTNGNKDGKKDGGREGNSDADTAGKPAAKAQPVTEPEAGTKTEAGAKAKSVTEPGTDAGAKTQSVTKTETGTGGTAKDGKTGRAGKRRIRGEKPAASAPPMSGRSKTSALTRTTPLRRKAVAGGTSSARAGTNPPVPEPSVPRGPRLSVRLRAWLRRTPRWWPLPVCLVLGAGAGGAYSEITPPQYSAISYVVVSPSGPSEAGGALGYAQAFGKIATDPMILADAEKRAGLRRGTIRQGIQATTSPDAPMVQITATSSSASQAAKNADAVAKALTHTAKASVKRTGARLTLLSQAVAPATPVSPSREVTVAVGACAGGLLGGLALLARPQSRRPEYTGSPVAADGGRTPEGTTGSVPTSESTSANSLTEAGR